MRPSGGSTSSPPPGSSPPSSLPLLVYRRRWLAPAPLGWPLPAQRPPDDGRLLLLAEVALDQPSPRHHRQHARSGGPPGGSDGRPMVTPVRDQRGPDWAPGQRAGRAAPPGRPSGSGWCGPGRRPGPPRLGDGPAPTPRRARVHEPGHHQAGQPFGHWRARASVAGRGGGPGLAAGRRRAGLWVGMRQSPR
jgi:hypothetical protein